jgi:hypothetical protein
MTSLLEELIKSKSIYRNKILLYLALNGETDQYDLHKILNYSYRQSLRDVKKLKNEYYIKVTDTTPSDTKGIDKNILGITLMGLVFLFYAIPEFWGHFEEIITIPNNRKLLPIIFNKLNLFKGNKEIYSELIQRLRAIFTIFATRGIIIEGVFLREAYVRELGKNFVQEFNYPKNFDLNKMRDRDKKYEKIMGIESEILLNLFFGYQADFDPFMILMYAPFTYAEDKWSEPMNWRGNTQYEIMEIAASDPELREFFELIIQVRKGYTTILEKSSESLKSSWEFSKQESAHASR